MQKFIKSFFTDPHVGKEKKKNNKIKRAKPTKCLSKSTSLRKNIYHLPSTENNDVFAFCRTLNETCTTTNTHTHTHG